MRNVRLLATVAALAAAIGAPATAKAVGPDPTQFDFNTVSASFSDDQAGAHADFTTFFSYKLDPVTQTPFAAARDVSVASPAGLVGDPSAFPVCDVQRFVLSVNWFAGNPFCPQDSQIGVADVTLGFGGGFNPQLREPIYNLPPTSDSVARVGFIGLTFPVILQLNLRSDSDYGVTALSTSTADVSPINDVQITLWGVPGDPSHDEERLTPEESSDACTNACLADNGHSRPSGIGPVPFLTNPTSCGNKTVSFSANTYPQPGVVHTASADAGTITGCANLPFSPTLTASPTSSAAAAPSGLSVDLKIPQTNDPNTLATADLRKAVVTLPQGVTINPAAADGLGSCSADQAGFGTMNAPACPDNSKLGTATITSPALARPIEGAIYQRTPELGHLFRIWLTADDLGVKLKLPGDISLDPTTGQIVTTFDNNPQLPVSDIDLEFNGGPHGVLSTPPRCGTYQTVAELTPWSGNPPVTSTSQFTIDQNCGTGAFSPKINAGLQNPAAGSSSPFTLQLTQGDGEQNLAGLTAEFPPGLLASLNGVPECSDLDAQAGACPDASRVGSVVLGTGSGPDPLYIPQAGKAPTSVYFAGPYKGAPFSLVVKVPAQAGPFDLGTVVTREALFIDPTDAHVSVVSDPLPQIIQGVPVSYRDLRVIIDRPGFMRAPTSCNPMTLDFKAMPADGPIHVDGQGVGYASQMGTPANLTSRFQVGGCQDLGFAPKLKIALSGKGKTHSGNHPTLTATLTQPAGQANIRQAKVALPLSLALDPNNSQHVCNYQVAQTVHGGTVGCPASTIVGRATAVTPLLSQPLSGPVYLVQGIRLGAQGQAIHTLPSLLIPLRGQIALDLRAQSAVSGGRLVTTFSSIPDAPVSKFTLKINGGRTGILVITGRGKTICGKKQVSNATLGAQSGKTMRPKVTMGTPCPKAKHKPKKHGKKGKTSSAEHVLRSLVVDRPHWFGAGAMLGFS